MNKLVRFFLMFSLAFTVFACGDDDEPVVTPPTLTVNAADKTAAFDVTGGSKTIVVTASAAFTAVSDQSWCTVSGLTQSLFVINVTENTATEARTAKVTVALSGATSVEITVTQAAVVVVIPPATLVVSPLMFHFDTPAAGEKLATVATNRDDYIVTVQEGETWVTYEKTTVASGGEEVLALKIKVEASEVEAEREATVTVHVDGATDVVLHVTQAAYVPPVIPEEPSNATSKWNVAASGTIEWYTRGANKTIGTPSEGAPSTVAGPIEGVQAWALGKDDHIKVVNPIAAPTTVYTLLWDVRIPTLSGYCSLLQTKVDNNDGDGDVFLNGKKIGLGDYSGEVLTANTWHRLVVTVDAADAKKALFYVDGQLAAILKSGAFANPDGSKDISGAGDTDRYTLQDIFWLFLDDGDEVYPIDCAGFALWNKVLTPGEVLWLGNATTPVN